MLTDVKYASLFLVVKMYTRRTLK